MNGKESKFLSEINKNVYIPVYWFPKWLRLKQVFTQIFVLFSKSRMVPLINYILLTRVIKVQN